MDRVEKLREYIDAILLNKEDSFDRRCAYVHLYGVAQACVLLAKKRGLNEELAVMAGMLHDIYTYKVTYTKEHGEKGAAIACEILEELGITTAKETHIICNAIYNHSYKEKVGSPYDELLKDADVLQHCIYNPAFPVLEKEEKRYNSILAELGIN